MTDVTLCYSSIVNHPLVIAIVGNIIGGVIALMTVCGIKFLMTGSVL